MNKAYETFLEAWAWTKRLFPWACFVIGTSVLIALIL